MYYAVIIGMMLVLPLASAGVEVFALASSAGWVAILGKWFVFWGVGARLGLAGARQLLRPGLTLDLLHIKDPAASTLARELGFGNLSIGLIGLLSLPFPDWTMAAAAAGGLFYGLAGIQHLAVRDRGTDENWALWSDLWMFAVMVVYLALSWAGVH